MMMIIALFIKLSQGSIRTKISISYLKKLVLKVGKIQKAFIEYSNNM